MIDLKETISELIAKQTEGGYWDFKSEWYKYNTDLLHDIICMANNIENRDAYIIIGVTNSGDFSTLQNNGRKNTAQLTDFIRTIRFVGQFRPIVRVESILISNKEIDVIVIENTTNTPYILEEDFVENKNSQAEKRIRQGNIYTRIQDTNTPVNKTADYDKVELLWKKRFHLNASPLEKFNYYIKDTDNWISDSYANGLYYKYSNELFKIQKIAEKENVTNSVLDYIGIYGPWSKYRVEITWQNVVIKTDEVLSNSRYSVLKPDFIPLEFRNDTNKYWFWYFVMDSNRELLNRLIIKDCCAQIVDFDFYSSIICFKSAKEKNDFEDYLRNDWSILKNEFDKIKDNQNISTSILQNDLKCTEFFPRIFKEWKQMLPNE